MLKMQFQAEKSMIFGMKIQNFLTFQDAKINNKFEFWRKNSNQLTKNIWGKIEFLNKCMCFDTVCGLLPFPFPKKLDAVVNINQDCKSSSKWNSNKCLNFQLAFPVFRV